MSSLPCKIKSGEFSRHLIADFFNSLGYKETSSLSKWMSALPPRADVTENSRHDDTGQLFDLKSDLVFGQGKPLSTPMPSNSQRYQPNPRGLCRISEPKAEFSLHAALEL